MSVSTGGAFVSLRVLDDSGEIDIKIWRQDNDEVICEYLLRSAPGPCKQINFSSGEPGKLHCPQISS